MIHVGPGQCVHAEAVVWPRRRGELLLGDFRVSSTFPFGIAKKSVTFSQGQAAIVRPARFPLRRDLLSDLHSRSDAGREADRTAGRGEEFFALRDYAPGDSPRMIAWRASARTGQLVVRQNAAPTPASVLIALEFACDDEHYHERAISLAASLIARAYGDGMEVGLLTPTSSHRPRRSVFHVEHMFDDLATLVPGGSDEPYQGVSLLASQQRTPMVVVDDGVRGVGDGGGGGGDGGGDGGGGGGLHFHAGDLGDLIEPGAGSSVLEWLGGGGGSKSVPLWRRVFSSQQGKWDHGTQRSRLKPQDSENPVACAPGFDAPQDSSEAGS